MADPQFLRDAEHYTWQRRMCGKNADSAEHRPSSDNSMDPILPNEGEKQAMSVERLIRIVTLCAVLAAASSAMAQTPAAVTAQSASARLEIAGEYQGHYWIVETSADGSRRGGWVSKQTPLDRIDRTTLQPIQPLRTQQPTAAALPPLSPAPSPTGSMDDRLARIEQALANLSAPSAAPQAATPTASAPARQVGQPRPQPPIGFTSSALAQTQRGDFAVGYVYLNSEASLPLGVALSDGFRLNPNLDLVVEGQYAHGTADVLVAKLGLNVWAVQAGIRGWGGSRYGDGVRAFGQVLTGFGGFKVNLGSVASGSVTGWTVQPGGGVEIPLNRTVAIRPQFDVLLGRLEGTWGRDPRVNLNVVFRFFE